ncbi:UDP-N-acetylglucosamine--N-acetylmuramyl-(pentapeptide) pyrophosphoryl-undecaprenol N-acetylglucosamine transferase [Calditerrivibrio sp.]|uniref:UDP-N-acetylglucosamine--N-acetylmuramyl- (pentapeptide) pyrophosphoryl-undecaprenol N-acetylglucosamine transferase n=1 Tax=Calditerrivibrio sp. TaxID=2792612 RepID=UPI003D13D33C
MKIVIAGGGTGGHLYPGIAIAEKLKDKGIELLFMVSNRGIEKRILTPLGYKFIEQEETPLKGVSFGRRIKSVGKIIENIKIAMNNVDKSDKVLLLGGFASFSAGMAGMMKSAEIYIHEQNSVMGLSNRFFAKRAKKVFTSFEKTLRAPENSIVVGNPVRSVFALSKSKISPEKNILVVGGSQGSRFLNNLIISAAEELISNGFDIMHQTGERLYDEVIEAYRNSGIDTNRLNIVRYIDDIASAYNWADLVLSRAGSGSVFEIIYSRRFGIFVPFPDATDNHQYYNALFAEAKGVGVVIEEKDAKKEVFIKAVNDYYENFEKYRENIEKITYVDSAELILREMEMEYV